MSEQHPKDYEQFITPEIDQERQETLAQNNENLHSTPNRHSDNIDTIRSTINQEALAQESINDAIQHEHHNQHRPHHYITKKIKSQQYKQTVIEIQKSLTPTQRRFSSVIHQPAIERVSEVGAKTIARPSGIVGGALMALIGSAIIGYIARHIGFEVPTTIFAILFIVGFVVGLLIELLVYAIRHPKKRNQHTTHY